MIPSRSDPEMSPPQFFGGGLRSNNGRRIVGPPPGRRAKSPIPRRALPFRLYDCIERQDPARAIHPERPAIPSRAGIDRQWVFCFPRSEQNRSLFNNDTIR